MPVAALDRGIEAALRNDRRVVVVSLALLAALAWLYLWRDAVAMADMGRQMDMSFPMAMTPNFALTFVMWAVMMVGMMLPSAAPTILLYATLVRKQGGARPALAAVWIFTAGYLVAWTGFSLLAAALQVGLDGAVNVERIGGDVVGGVGGHADFARGASACVDGLSIVMLRSQHRGRSTIVPSPEVITTARTDVDLVVTEHGVADLRGRSDAERARLLVEIAHPDHRDALAWRRE